MNSFPAIIFCHHNDLDVEPARAWCHQPYKSWPSLVSMKIDYLRRKGFSPFFIVVTDADAAKTCEQYQAEDVHVVQIPVNVIPAAPKINRRVWSIYNPRADYEHYNYAAYMLCTKLGFNLIYSEPGYFHTQSDEILEQVLGIDQLDFDYGLGFSHLGANLIYSIHGLKAFFERKDVGPIVDYDFPLETSKTRLFSLSDRVLIDGTDGMRDYRLISEYRYNEWCQFMDDHGAEYEASPYNTIKKYGPKFFKVQPRPVYVSSVEELGHVKIGPYDTLVLTLPQLETEAIHLLQTSIALQHRLHVILSCHRFPEYLKQFHPHVTAWEIMFEYAEASQFLDSLEARALDSTSSLLNALVTLEGSSFPLVGASIKQSENPIDTIACYRLMEKLVRPSLFVGSVSLRWKARYLFDFLKVSTMSDTLTRKQIG